MDAHQSGRITIVLSAWHFYEYGNASGHPETEDLIWFAEELQPQWILERGDLQHQEFIVFWNCIWGSAPLVFISSLHTRSSGRNSESCFCRKNGSVHR